jgi:hypothetical protein
MAASMPVKDSIALSASLEQTRRAETGPPLNDRLQVTYREQPPRIGVEWARSKQTLPGRLRFGAVLYSRIEMRSAIPTSKSVTAIACKGAAGFPGPCLLKRTLRGSSLQTAYAAPKGRATPRPVGVFEAGWGMNQEEVAWRPSAPSSNSLAACKDGRHRRITSAGRLKRGCST